MSALLRFSEEGGLLGIEWGDGSPPSVYAAGAARDAVLAALLDMAQVGDEGGWGGGVVDASPN